MTPPGETASDLFCGIDVGASATKLVLLDATRAVRARVVRASGVDYAATARACLEQALEQAAAGDAVSVRRTVATGYGRESVAHAHDRVTEIHCHGVGAYHLVPRRITIVDIGGQDNKVIKLDAGGKRIEFRMNRKCAAGTGAFLEEIAVRLDIPLGDLDRLARSTTEAVQLSSFCTVFAKTEILAHLRRGVPIEHIVRGAYLSVVGRVVEMDRLAGEIVLTGGVAAHHQVVRELVAERTGAEVTVPPFPQFAGALGAALIGAREAVSSSTA